MSFQEFSNVPYAAQTAAQQLDVYLPEDAAGEQNVVLIIHGGGWMMGDKHDHTRDAERFAQRGFVSASMNYRLLSTEQAVTFSEMVDDVENAIVKLDAFLREKGITPRRLAITGVSAGGHLTLLYAVTRLAACKIPVAFLAPDVGPSDFTDEGYLAMHDTDDILPLVSGLIGQEITVQDMKDKSPALLAASPLYHITSAAPPMLLRYGGRDELVPLSNGTRLKAALDAVGVPNDFFMYENSGHGLNNTKDAPGTDYAVHQAYKAALEDYLVRYFS